MCARGAFRLRVRDFIAVFCVCLLVGSPVGSPVIGNMND